MTRCKAFLDPHTSMGTLKVKENFLKSFKAKKSEFCWKITSRSQTPINFKPSPARVESSAPGLG